MLAIDLVLDVISISLALYVNEVFFAIKTGVL